MEKPHLSPLHWQRGTEVFHVERRRFSDAPFRDGLIFSNNNITSGETEIREEERKEKVKIKKRK